MIDVKNAVGVVVITVEFYGDIDSRGSQDETVRISGTDDTSTIDFEIDILKFQTDDDVTEICGPGLGFICCKIEKSYSVFGDDLKDFSFLRFEPSPDVFPWGGCSNEFNVTIEYCGFDDGTIFL